VNLSEELGLVSPVWQGTRLPDVHTVYLTPETETDAYGRTLPLPKVSTPGGVYIWPNGYITCFTNEAGDKSEGVIYPPDTIACLKFGPMSESPLR
jgi:hypothetical protein